MKISHRSLILLLDLLTGLYQPKTGRHDVHSVAYFGTRTTFKHIQNESTVKEGGLFGCTEFRIKYFATCCFKSVLFFTLFAGLSESTERWRWNKIRWAHDCKWSSNGEAYILGLFEAINNAYLGAYDGLAIKSPLQNYFNRTADVLWAKYEL